MSPRWVSFVVLFCCNAMVFERTLQLSLGISGRMRIAAISGRKHWQDFSRLYRRVAQRSAPFHAERRCEKSRSWISLSLRLLVV
jgi:hypothetical protein